MVLVAAQTATNTNSVTRSILPSNKSSSLKSSIILATLGALMLGSQVSTAITPKNYELMEDLQETVRGG